MRSLLLAFASVWQVLEAEQRRGDGALTIPFISKDLSTPEQLHNALEPAWDSLVEQRNSAGLVAPKDEGKPQPPLSKEETAFQFDRVQRGEVDSARLLLVFGMVPSASHIDNETLEAFLQDRNRSTSEGDGSNLPAVVAPDARYPDGSTPLHMAATFGLEHSVRGLLDARADIQALSLSGVQAVHAAAIMGHVAVIDILHERGANLDVPHKFAKSTPLHFAAEMGHHQVVQRLCELGADVEAEKSQGGTAIHVSADTNNAAVARTLLEKCDADPDAVLLGDTVPLYLAAGRGFPEVIEVLLELGANPDRTLWPHRPWHKKKKRRKAKAPVSDSTAVSAHLDLKNVLPGSHPDAPGWEVGNGATAMHNAAENGHISGVKALMEGGARQLATMQGITPLISSLQYKHPKVASAMLDHRTPSHVEVTNPQDGQSALHVAAAYDYPEVVARILREGGDTELKDRRGNTPTDYGRGQVTRFVLSRFHGRAPKLDAIVRSNPEGDLAQLFTEAAKDAATQKTREIYIKYAQYHEVGTLAARAASLAQRLKKEDRNRDESNADMQRLSIARFLMARSDAPIAVEAMMHKTEAGMHVGLILLGVKVETLEYTPQKSVKVNGHELHELTNRVVQAAVRSSQTQDASDFEVLAESLRNAAEGVRPQAEESSAGETQKTSKAEATSSDTEQDDGEDSDEQAEEEEDALEL